MKKELFLLSSLCVTLVACESYQSSTPTTTDSTTGRDVRGGQMTDLTENESDRVLTQKVRQALMDDDTLSTNAKNIKIIIVNGVATLRGSVNSEKEKSDVGRKTKSISGVRNVDNQLEIIRTNNSMNRATDNRDFNR